MVLTITLLFVSPSSCGVHALRSSVAMVSQTGAWGVAQLNSNYRLPRLAVPLLEITVPHNYFSLNPWSRVCLAIFWTYILDTWTFAAALCQTLALHATMENDMPEQSKWSFLCHFHRWRCCFFMRVQLHNMCLTWHVGIYHILQTSPKEALHRACRTGQFFIISMLQV